ncbi:hypothetical protein [Myceligenerans salitolerans]|uniref:Uncharacterized protein n=1 Tax=Myceligenerans salitolerans TaxID=1230528 RepID=A0ABS3IA73_9MICO|nr:hypothetical protein [Myceligenerans salitolerans]MBO0609927.1 hypothetical protein [Myceligenerans salitolerans]
MRIVKITVEAPRNGARIASARVVEAVQAAAAPRDELVHVYAGPLPTGFGVVVFLLVPRDQAAATACRLVLDAADALELSGWTLGTVRVWGPDVLS